MISFYRFKRYAFYLTLLAVPFLFFIIMFFTIGLKRIYLGEGFYVTVISPIDTLICIVGSLVFGGVIIAIGNKILRHPMLTMIEGKGLLSLILDSTGLIGCFNVIVNAPKMLGKKPGENLELDETYDVDIMHRIIFPKDAPLVQGFEVNRDETTGKTFFKPKMVLVLPDEEKKHDTLFRFESMPVFIYNKVMGQFLSRNMLAKNEKHMQLKHSSLNILYKLATLGDVFRDFGRYAGELTRPKPKGIFARWPWLKYVLIGVVILVIILIIFMFIPGFSKSFGNLQI